MKLLNLSLLVIGVAAAGCELANPHEYNYSFEEGMDSWQPRRADIELGQDTIAWHIRRTDTLASDGTYSLELYIENYNDAGKIWVERALNVESGRHYHISVSYSFASADWGMANLFNLVTGVMRRPPRNAADIVNAVQDNTGNGLDEDSGYAWLKKSFDYEVDSDSSGTIYVFIGVWGTWETPRTYYLDDVTIELR